VDEKAGLSAAAEYAGGPIIPASAASLHRRPPAVRSWQGAAILLLTVLAYVPAVNLDFIWDDDFYVTENQTLRDLDGLGRIWAEPGATPQYYPLVHTTFWIEYQLWQLKPAGYHVVNVLFHAATAVLWWRLLMMLGIPGAWLAAALFAVHPVHVESVAWITERKNVLSGALYVAAAIAYVRFSGIRDDRDWSDRPWRWYAVAFLAFAGALLSKTVTATLPAALVMVLWWQRRRLPWRDLACLVPFLIVGAAAGLHTAHLEREFVGAKGPEWDFSFADRWLIAGRAFWFYAWKVVWPQRLVFFYPRWIIDDSDPRQYLYPVLAVGLMAALAIAGWRTRRWGPLVAVLFFAGTLFPALGFLNVFPFIYSFVADHFQYLASMGVIALVAGAAAAFFAMGNRTAQRIAMAAAVIIIAGFIGRTWRHLPAFEDEMTLWYYTIAGNDRAWMAHNNLGNFLDRQGRHVEGLRHLQEAIGINPGNDRPYYNMGTILAHRGAHRAAAGYFTRAWEMHRRAKTANNLAVSLMHIGGHDDQAIELLRYVTQNMPDQSAPHHNLAKLLINRDMPEEALVHLRQARKHSPNDAGAAAAEGLALEKLGRWTEAVKAYSDAVRLGPSDAGARVKLGIATARVGRTTDAMHHLRRAIELDPKNAGAHANLAVVLEQSGDLAGAVTHLRQAIAIDPQRHATMKSLAWILATSSEKSLRRPEEAVDLARRAVSLVPQPDALYLDTLAAALAAAGQYEQAQETARRAAEVAAATGRQALEEQIRQRLRLYEQGQTFRRKPESASAPPDAPDGRP
jgi:tetratricopeptide (TPR) repeat protein